MLNAYQKIACAYLSLLVIYWFLLFASHETDSFYNLFYSFAFSLVPLICGAFGMYGSKVWGGIRSYVGKAIFLISIGLFAWGSGSMVWSYYNFFMDVPAPYPSIADIGFAPSVFFYSLGTVYLSKATGAKFGLRSKYAKFFVVLAPIVILAISYYTLVSLARAGVLVSLDETTPLKIMLDIAYPFGDFLGLTIAVVISGLSFQYMGGNYTWDMIGILSGLAVMFIADFIFSYTTTVGTFYNGNFGDLVFTIGLFLLSFGVLGFSKMKIS